jgi:uncharacterized protein (DUF885 family)
MAVHARIDLGVNYEGWTLEQTTERFAEYYSEDEAAAFAQDMYEAVAQEPSKYLSYYATALKFETLRKKAEQALGKRFNPKAFHAVILDLGPCFFEIVEQAVNEYIVENGGEELQPAA